MQSVEDRLKGGHPNSLGNTVEVVEDIQAGKVSFEELFNAYFSDDELVRLRVSNGVRRLAREDETVLLPHIDSLLNKVSAIDQDSTQWTYAQLVHLVRDHLNERQTKQALEHMKHNLLKRDDWIVQNTTMETLGEWARDDAPLKKWLVPQLKTRSKDSRKSVANRAKKLLVKLED